MTRKIVDRVVRTVGIAALAMAATSSAHANDTSKETKVDALPIMVQHTIIRHAGTPPFSTRGPGCPQTVASLTAANFSGGQVIVEAGLAQTEIAATQYTLPAAAFPIKVDLLEFILAGQNLSVQTVTQYSVLVWDGPPDTGTVVAEYMSDDIMLPYARVGPGTAGTNIQVSVDPGDPEQIFVTDVSGTHTFTIGLRIDHHNNQTADPCFTAPPSNSNAFPCVDANGLQNSSSNWLFGVNCGSFGCPANGGWARFSQLISLCRPSGDWAMRATWESINCTAADNGSCCSAAGACSVTTQVNCASGSAWTDLGVCSPNPCPQPTGACCQASGSCTVGSGAACASPAVFQGAGTTCGAQSCPGACCIGTGCLTASPGDCGGVGGTYQGSAAACVGGSCPTGACCITSSGACSVSSPAACTSSGGTYGGNASACNTTFCPLPTGACCASNGFCLTGQTQAACNNVGFTWQGGGTVCTPSPCSAAGVCCRGATCATGITQGSCTSPGAGIGASFASASAACNSVGANTTPCCYADFNKANSITVQDIFDFLGAWFNSSPYCRLGGNGTGAPVVQDIFNFLNAWFSGC